MFTPLERRVSVRLYTVDEMQCMLQHISPGDTNPYCLGSEPYSLHGMSDPVEYDEHRMSLTRQNLPSVTNGHHTWQIHIVGGGPMAHMAAIELAIYARQLGLNLHIFLYERAAYGGGKGVAPATIASHAWLHLQGAFYAKSQPEVTLQLQQSTRRLQELAPAAFTYPLAFTVDRVGDLPAHFDPLGVWYEPLADSVARAHLARWGMRLPAAAALLRISDASIDIRLLGYHLMNEAHQLGVNLVPCGIDRLELRGETISALRLSNGEHVNVAPGGQVILACGAQIRPLLATAGLHVDGLQVFGSQLLGAHLGIPALFTAIGSVSIVPHDESGCELVNVIGDANRRPLSDEEALHPRPDPSVTRQTRCETEDLYGLRLPDDTELLAWVGTKTEITSGERSQAAHARRIPGLSNGWLCIPGKLSATAACAASLSQKVLRHLIEEPIAWHIYEMLSAGTVMR